MEENLIDEFRPEIRDALFDVAETVLQMKNVKVWVNAGSKKGIVYIFRLNLTACDMKIKIDR